MFTWKRAAVFIEYPLFLTASSCFLAAYMANLLFPWSLIQSVSSLFAFFPFLSFAHWLSSDTEALYGVGPHAEMFIVACWIMLYRERGAQPRLCIESMPLALMFQPQTNVHMCRTYGQRKQRVKMATSIWLKMSCR